ncbi:MAG: hypothetical protein ACI9GM_001219 [Salibacteraceae bacterium]|jgi:hypothetical protein
MSSLCKHYRNSRGIIEIKLNFDKENLVKKKIHLAIQILVGDID